MSVNINIFNFNSNGVGSGLLDGIGNTALDGVEDVLSSVFRDFAGLFDSVGSQFSNPRSIMAGGCVPPSPANSCHPSGSLRADAGAGVVTTPGGYKIEATGQFEWKITGPDGKTTRVWGDPHVAEGDGGKWDFKRNSTFILGDGTRVNVTTAPWKDGKMTVTSGLEIISGNDRVQISDIDKGKGVVGAVTPDGWSRANSFGGNDVFVMGRETDDWSFQGKEVIGSENGGESFKLGANLPAGGPLPPSYANDFADMLRSFVDDLIGDWNQTWRPNDLGVNPYFDDGRLSGVKPIQYDAASHRNQLGEAFRLVGDLFRTLGRLSQLSEQMSGFRYRTLNA